MSTPQADQRQVRTPLLIALGVVVAVTVVLVGVVPLLSGGDDDAALAPLPVVPSAPTEAPGDAPTVAPTEEPEEVPADVEAVSARDPFTPLVQPTEPPGAAAAAAAPAAGQATPSVSTSGDATAGGPASTAAPATATSAPSGGVPASATPSAGPDATLDGSEVSLADVFTGTDGAPRILVAVDGVAHEASAGATIAERFGVVSIDGACATLSSSGGETLLCQEVAGSAG